MKQLVMFKNIDVKKLDASLTELHNFMYAMKHFALVIETSFERGRAFNLALESVRLSADILADLSDLSFKYQDHSRATWKRLSIYEPYYAALETRSPFRLYEIASDYKSRSNAILLRLEACLRAGAIRVPKQIDELRNNMGKLKQSLHNEKFEL